MPGCIWWHISSLIYEALMMHWLCAYGRFTWCQCFVYHCLTEALWFCFDISSPTPPRQILRVRVRWITLLHDDIAKFWWHKSRYASDSARYLSPALIIKRMHYGPCLSRSSLSPWCLQMPFTMLASLPIDIKFKAARIARYFHFMILIYRARY